MIIYIINFIVNMLLGFFLLYNKNISEKKYIKRKKMYLIITIIQFATLCGLRSTKIAYDTYAYEIIFNQAPSTFASIFNNTSHVEIGFSILCSIIKIFGGNFQILLMITSFFVMGSCCIFIYRHSNNILLSVFIIISFPFYYSSFDIIRHFVALSFFLLGYKYIENNNFVKYLIYIFIGSLFHSISLLFIPFYFIKKIKFNFVTFVVMILLTVFCFFQIDNIAYTLSSIIHKGSYIHTDWINSYSGGIKTAIMYCAIFIVSYFQFKNIKNKTSRESNYLMNILILFIFSIIFINARMMTRMIMSTVPLLAISLPQLLYNNNTINKKYSSIYIFITIIIGMAYHSFMLINNWQNVVPYIPFWK